jgi:hypothetical protein
MNGNSGDTILMFSSLAASARLGIPHGANFQGCGVADRETKRWAIHFLIMAKQHSVGRHEQVFPLRLAEN